MKVLQIFSRYLQRGGEEVFSDQFRKVASEFMEISDFAGSTRNFLGEGLFPKITAPFRVFHDGSVAQSLKKAQRKEKFDAWLVQNALPGLTPSVYSTAFHLGIPVIQYLHNYRMGCTNGFFLNHGKPCERCLAGNFWPAFQTACWRDSRLISGMMGLVLRRVRSLATFQKVAAWIALSHYAKGKHAEMGIPESRIHVVPHFYSPKATPASSGKRQGNVLFLGRLSREKGLDVLLHAWKNVRPGSRALILAGTGPEEGNLKALAADLGLTSVRFAGFVHPEDQPALWSETSFAVLPSIWHEPFPLSFLESWANSRAVVASRVGAMAENITDGREGLLVEAYNAESLARAIQNLIDFPELALSMGKAGADKLARDFNQEVWTRRIKEVFRTACGKNFF